MSLRQPIAHVMYVYALIFLRCDDDVGRGRIYVSALLIRTGTRRIKMSFILARGAASMALKIIIHVGCGYD